MDKTLRNCGDNLHQESMQRKISEMKLTLSLLKERLAFEKKYLQQQKQEMSDSYPYFYCQNFEKLMPETKNSSTEYVNNRELYLKDIEARCEQGIESVNTFLSNVVDIKNAWLKLRESGSGSAKNDNKAACREKIGKKQSEEESNRFSSKGKVFYLNC